MIFSFVNNIHHQYYDTELILKIMANFNMPMCLRILISRRESPVSSSSRPYVTFYFNNTLHILLLPRPFSLFSLNFREVAEICSKRYFSASMLIFSYRIFFLAFGTLLYYITSISNYRRFTQKQT